ncbi:DinB family protein [Sphaerisporangium corydalis]|uniref:DinB family protein n=1 Tax=Sphaerisporangium corydalis TaxID=1441875 RepID=A0ABV9EGH9_9ACTN|nr:DinB family protein [Sphaerisporangium corydalis]
MTWIAPNPARVEAPTIADERTMLEGWLDFHRQTLLSKCAGLTSDQLKQRAVAPSSLSLLGLVRHMTEVERSWFKNRFAGEPDTPYYYSDDNLDGDFDDVDTADAEACLAAFTREVETVREVAASRSLDETFMDPFRKVEMSLRWIYVHMIEEYARHNGHADILRERIDGVTGE